MVGVGPKKVYPSIGADLTTVGLDEIGVYIDCHHNMVTQYIATHPIMDLCLAAERKPVLQLFLWRWWEHPALDILGIRAGHAEAEVGGETGTEESEGDRDYYR